MRTRPDFFYQQSAVVPFRGSGDNLEILVITSRRKRRWVVPKGVKEPDMSAQDSAAKEALEEAGIEGDVLPGSIGSYDYEKWGGTCTVDVYAMEVKKVYDDWLESFRDRQWVSIEEAAGRLGEDGLKAIVRSLPGHLET
jgi:phosphohistidine phosphatase